MDSALGLASQFGQSQTSSKRNNKLAELNSMRHADAKRAAAMVLNSPHSSQMGLTLSELDKLNVGKFQHGKTLLENQKR